MLGLAAFIMSIAWLNVEANETVAILEAFGLLFGIDTGWEERERKGGKDRDGARERGSDGSRRRGREMGGGEEGRREAQLGGQ